MASIKRTALVTGGANGIGRALCLHFAKHGYWVALADKDNEHGSWWAGQLKKKKFRADFLPVDMESEASILRLAAAVKALFKGRLDLLINNAATSSGGGLARSRQEWDKVLAVNLGAPYACVAALSPLMPEGSGVINIASTRALMSEPGTEPYSASKGGLLALTHSLALSLGPKRIRVNAVSPGWIDTSMWQGKNPKPAKLTKRDHAQHPVGRVGRPEDIAEACLFLADNDKAGFITGANLVVDGGMTKKMIYD